MNKHIFTQPPLWPSLMLGLFLVLSLLSFTASSYTPPWTNLDMEAFAFLAIFFLFLSQLKYGIKIAADVKLYFLLAFISISFFCQFFGSRSHHEGLVLSLLYISACGLIFSLPLYGNMKLERLYLLTILSAGLINAVAICAQQWDMQHILPFASGMYDPQSGRRPYGNLGQPNLAATLVLTALLCSFYLQHSIKEIGFLHALLVIIFSFALAYTASRTAFLALGFLIIFSLVRRDWKAVFNFSSASMIIIAIRVFSPSPPRPLIGGDVSGGRFDLWRVVWEGISLSPWWGYGALSTRLTQFAASDFLPFTKDNSISSAHNIFLDFFAWFGLPLGLALSILLAAIIYKYFKSTWAGPSFYLAIPISIHALLEYPLHNANFLFLFAILLQLKIKNESSPSNSQSKSLPYFFLAMFTSLGLLVFYEYNKLVSNYTELRFFNNHIAGSHKPDQLEPLFLDVTVEQYNAFLLGKINSPQKAISIAELTPYSPSFQNFLLLSKYYRERGDAAHEAYWVKKAEAYLSEPYMSYILNKEHDQPLKDQEEEKKLFNK